MNRHQRRVVNEIKEFMDFRWEVHGMKPKGADSMRPKYRLEIFQTMVPYGDVSVAHRRRPKRLEYMAHIVSTRNGEVLWRQSETYVKKEHCLRVAKGVLGLNDAVLERTDIVVKDLT